MSLDIRLGQRPKPSGLEGFQGLSDSAFRAGVDRHVGAAQAGESLRPDVASDDRLDPLIHQGLGGLKASALHRVQVSLIAYHLDPA